MKQKHLKIVDNTLFVYRPQQTLKNGTTETDSTDPTTSMVTLTKTGIFKSGQSN
jgi:hypothetical protein